MNIVEKETLAYFQNQLGKPIHEQDKKFLDFEKDFWDFWGKPYIPFDSDEESKANAVVITNMTEYRLSNRTKGYKKC